MKLMVFWIFGLVVLAFANADSSSNSGEDSNESSGESKDKFHYEILFDKQEAKKSVFINTKTKSLYSCDLANQLIILIDGASGSGLIVNLKSLKAWKLNKGWKASGNDIVKSAIEFLIKIKSLQDLIEKNEEEIDLIKDQIKIQWILKTVVVNIIDEDTKNPDIISLINLELAALESKEYVNLYLSQKGKGLKVAVSVVQIMKIEHLIKAILAGINIQKEKLLQIKIEWSKIYGYKGDFVGAALLLIEQITISLKKEITTVHTGLIIDVSKTCAKIIKNKGGKGGKGSGSDSGSESNESGDKDDSKDKGSGSNESDD